MKVQYTCVQCGALDREVEVPARPSAETDVAVWLHGPVMAQVALDHRERGCAAPTCSLKIPMPKDADFLGQEIKQ